MSITAASSSSSVPSVVPPALAELCSLHNKNAIVTGGARGIGEAIALRFAEAGANVVVVDRDGDAVGAVVARIHLAGGRALGLVADVALPTTATTVVDACAKTFGSVDVLVNNAGIFPSKPFVEVDEGIWDRVLDVNLKAAFFFSQAAAQRMIAAGGGGSIVQIASIDALHPTGNLTVYDASKGGLVMLTKSMAKELAVNSIRVNAICPGGVATPGVDAIVDEMAKGLHLTAAQLQQSLGSGVPLGRMGLPDDIARAALFFASPLSSWVTGSTLVVDGGTLLK
jgi:2-deoxy-D-gluconate 3-dehydrogenase